MSKRRNLLDICEKYGIRNYNLEDNELTKVAILRSFSKRKALKVIKELRPSLMNGWKLKWKKLHIDQWGWTIK